MPTCAVCKRKDDEPEEYGEFMKKSGICVHYFCLLLATNLPQHGADHSGIMGFLVRDIRKEIKACAERTCCYCKKLNASIACYTCKKYFHQICGNENGSVSEFANEFHSYCHEHVPFKDEPMLPGMPKECWICKDDIGAFNPTQTLRAYCCQNGYVHRKCMRKYALSAGYYLRCLWCGKKDFREDIRRHGVFVPDCEARWDNNDTLRYEDLHRGYSQCDAQNCLCPRGRCFFSTKWKLKICNGCGASGVHSLCAGEKLVRDQYTCSVCADVLNRTAGAEESRKTNNCAFNYALYMSKTYEEFQPLPEPLPTAASSLASSSQKPLTKPMFLFTKDFEIAGTGQLEEDESKKSQEEIPCQTSDVVNFMNTDPLIQEIIAELVEEGRDLSAEDAMVDEVMLRMSRYLEIFGDDEGC